MNKVVLIGRLTKDVETRYSQGEDVLCIARYTLAVDRRRRANEETEADFISIVAFGRNGEFAEKYLRKGMKIAVEGHIQTGSYTNNEGKKIYTTDVIADSQEFCESKGLTNESSNVASDGFSSIPEGYEEDLPFRLIDKGV